MTPNNPFTMQKNERNCPLYICCHVRRVEANEGGEDEDDSEPKNATRVLPKNTGVALRT